jgi:hypothetical protein
MPIRINLLAEAQALEDMRRRDPVKRTIWVGAFLVIVILAMSSWLQLQAVIKKGEVSRLEGDVAARAAEFKQVLDNQRKLTDVTRRLESLHKLTCSRLLYGTLLNSLQQTTIEDVQLVRLRTDQSYSFTDEVKMKTNSDNRIIPGKPATATERIVVTLEAKDSGVNPGDQVNKFKQAVSESSYFKSFLGKTNEVRLTSLSPPQGGGAAGGKSFVVFTLECKFPEKTR